MILNISLKNYRSFKEEASFSLVAESSKSKEQNVFVQALSKGEDELRLLISDLENDMKEAAAKLDFERAASLRDQIATLKGLKKDSS